MMNKRLMTLLAVLLISLFTLSAVVPVSRHVGRVNTFPDSDSITAKAIEAVRSEMDASWFETYTTGDKALIDFWSETLLDLLPLTNVIAGEEKDNAVSLYDLDKQVYISFTFNADKLITSIDMES